MHARYKYGYDTGKRKAMISLWHIKNLIYIYIYIKAKLQILFIFKFKSNKYLHK
jgi:hypothetical protein